MNPDHPPLVRRLAALPLLFLDVRWDREDFAWKTGRPWEFGKRFLFRWNDAETLLFWGRLPILALGVLLLLVLYLFTRRHYGEPAALLAVFLGALHPDFLAHGTIVSTDLGITVFIFATVVAFEPRARGGDPGPGGGGGRAPGRGLRHQVLGGGASRHARAARAAGRAGRRTPSGAAPAAPSLAPRGRLAGDPLAWDLRPKRAKLAALALVFLALSVVAVPVIWAAYGFHSPMAVDPDANTRLFDWSTVEPGHPAARALFAGLRRSGILPDAWTWGFLHFLAHTEGRPAFLLGQHSASGFWYYFPATFLLKTPLPLLILFALGLVTARRTAAPRRVESLVLLPLGLFVGLSMLQSINIGHRHLLPAYPFVLVVAGRVAALALRARRRTLLALVGVLALGQAVTAARAFPHYLAYFNELGGGSANGWRHLVDSNLDWGQELKGLRRWMADHHVTEVKLAYFGTADVKYYGVAARRLPGYQPAPPGLAVREVWPGDVVVVSATLLQGLYLPPSAQGLMDLLRPRRPLAVIGHSLFVYRADFALHPSRADGRRALSRAASSNGRSRSAVPGGGPAALAAGVGLLRLLPAARLRGLRHGGRGGPARPRPLPDPP